MNKLHRAKEKEQRKKNIQLTKLKYVVYGSSDEYKEEQDVKPGDFMSNHNSTHRSLVDVQILNYWYWSLFQKE